MENNLTVLIHGTVAGTIKQEQGRHLFEYEPAYLDSKLNTPLSISVPIKLGKHDVGAWLEGLLPDNPFVLKRWQELHGVASPTLMHLLATPIGLDCAGAVQFCREGTVTDVLNRESGVRRLNKTQVARIIAELETDNSLWSTGEAKEAFSLAGAQSKIALRYRHGVWQIPHGNEPTTHILKPSMPRLRDQCLIEHLSQRTAVLLGISAAHTECVEVKGRRAILIHRYDRVRSEDGSYSRIHQEDMCQALNISSQLKYEGHGGPGVKDIGRVLHMSSQAYDDLRLFRDALLYSWLIVGTDAHAKNYSLVLNGQDVRMAPLYDMCSLLPYREDLALRQLVPVDPTPVSEIKLAMRTGEDYTVLKSDYRDAWEGTSRILGIPESETLSRAVELAAELPDALAEAIEELPPELGASPYVDKLYEEITKRARHCMHLELMTAPSREGDFA